MRSITAACLASLFALAACEKDLVPAAEGLGGPCSRNADCASPYVCLDSRCVPTPTQCDPGERRCNGGAVEQCDEDGATWVAGETCTAGCSGGRCLAPACEPGTKRCNGAALEACVPTGARFEFVQFCDSTCDDGACKPPPQACTANVTRCNGKALEKCTPDGLGWGFVEFCSHECDEGACVPAPPVCTPNETRCTDKAVEACKPDGLGWAFVEFCAFACEAGGCIDPAPACTPNETRCNGSAVEACTPDARGWAFVQYCATSCDEGRCTPAACRPFATRCAGVLNLETCAPDGTQWESAPCGDSYACEAGACRPVLCTAGAKRCRDRSVEACNALGTAWEQSESCTTGCREGACLPAACTPGEKRCSGNAVEQCAPDASSFVFVQYCATSCQTGACTLPVCAPLARRCSGKDVQVCDGAGSSWAKVDTCPDNCLDGYCVQRATLCGAGEKRCNGADVELCAADGKSWAKGERCLEACAGGACAGGACKGFTLAATPSTLPADGQSTALVVSETITDGAGVPVPDDTLFTIAVTGGQFASRDVDPVALGMQVRSVSGRLRFLVRATALAGPMSIAASYRLSDVCASTLELLTTTPAGRVVAAEDFASTARRDPIATTATWDTATQQAKSLPFDPALGVNVGNGRDGDLVVTGGTTFNLMTSKRPGLASPDVVAHRVTFIDTRYGRDFVFVDPPANTTLSPGDEIMLLNAQGGCCSGASCDASIPCWSSYAGTYEFLTVRDARPDGLVFFTTPVKSVYSDGGNADIRGQRIFVQRVPNYDRVTVEGTLTSEAWNPDERRTGIIAFRARRGVTVADPGGRIDATGLGYRGGKGDKTSSAVGSKTTNSPWTSSSINYSASQQAGESYTGEKAGYANHAAWAGGGAGGGYAECTWFSSPGANRISGGGGGYATAGYRLTIANGTYPPGDVGRGGTYGDAALSKLFLGSGGGGVAITGAPCRWTNGSGGSCWDRNNGTQCGQDTYCVQYSCCNCAGYCLVTTCSFELAGADGGRGGGIVAIWTHALDVKGGGIVANGAKPTATDNGGSGGSILLHANSASLGDKLVTALGASSSAYTVPAGQRPPGDGRIAINYFDFALTGSTNPPAYSNLLGVFRKNMVQSFAIDALDAPKKITKVKLVKALEQVAGGDITYEVSSDGGRTWTAVKANEEATIPVPSQGADLRWRALFRPLSTDPLAIEGLVFDYAVP